MTSPSKIKEERGTLLGRFEVIFSCFYDRFSWSNRCYFHNTTQSCSTASLASSSGSEEGGVPSPPRKKQRLLCSSSSNMQANGCQQQHNGATTEPSTSQMNGSCTSTSNGQVHHDHDRMSPVDLMSQTDRDIVRLIGQHLRSLGLQ